MCVCAHARLCVKEPFSDHECQDKKNEAAVPTTASVTPRVKEGIVPLKELFLTPAQLQRRDIQLTILTNWASDNLNTAASGERGEK